MFSSQLQPSFKRRPFALRGISAQNFKSFRNLDIELPDFCAIVGPNASGKSNFVNLFRFLRDTRRVGLDNAVSLQGGYEYLLTRPVDDSRELRVAIRIERVEGGDSPDTMRRRRMGGSIYGLLTSRLRYEFALSFGKTSGRCRVVEDRCELILGLRRLSGPRRHVEVVQDYGTVSVTFEAQHGKTKANYAKNDAWPVSLNEFLPTFMMDIGVPRGDLLLSSPLASFLFPELSDTIDSIAVYDFDPRLAKRAVPVTGKTVLEESGENIATVLQGIERNPKKKRMFLNLLRDVLPFIKNVKSERFIDKYVLFKLIEEYNPRFGVPSSLASDGTINVIALLLALYFEDAGIAVIEEPDRCLHPLLSSAVVGLLSDAALRRQVIVTTHSPDIVRNVGVEGLVLADRSAEGYSRLVRPADSEQVRTFLSNELGVDDLFVQGMLGV